MSHIILNDQKYEFHPFEMVKAAPGYKANESELKKSRETSKALTAFAMDYIDKLGLSKIE